MDAITLRHLLERLSLDVRTTATGTGNCWKRLSGSLLGQTGRNAGESVLMQLQRLPGLTPRDQEVGSRSFIDEDMLSALQGSAMARFVLEGKIAGARRGIAAPLNKRAVTMAAYMLSKNNANASTVVSVSHRVINGDACGGIEPQIAADCLEVAFALAEEEGVIDCQGIDIDSVYFGVIPLESFKINRLKLSGVIINEIVIDEIGLQSDISLYHCNIAK